MIGSVFSIRLRTNLLMSQIIENVACTACGCVCDDLRITLHDHRIAAHAPHCPIAEEWFKQSQCSPQSVAYLHEKPCSLEAAITTACDILHDARSPLVYGLSGSPAGQRAAVELADLLRGSIEAAASPSHVALIEALQEVGASTCTLGEIRHRADLVIYWGSDSVATQPRHLLRYSLEPRGEFVPDGRSGRHLLVCDVKETATAQQADQFIQIEPGTDFDILWTLRALVQGLPISQSSVGGVSLTTLTQIADRMKSCQCGVIFFGRGLTTGENSHAHVQALFMLVRELNAHTRFHARRMRSFNEATGADSLLSWQTGFPCSVNLARGYPRSNPSEYSAWKLLERGEVDACVLVGSAGLKTLSASALQRLLHIPSVLIDTPRVSSEFTASVHITCGVYGIHFNGVANRMDDVPIPLRALIPSPWPSDAEVLQKILALLKQRSNA
jgi:formylmethanofuran dehydrogenase subunit B